MAEDERLDLIAKTKAEIATLQAELDKLECPFAVGDRVAVIGKINSMDKSPDGAWSVEIETHRGLLRYPAHMISPAPLENK